MDVEQSWDTPTNWAWGKLVEVASISYGQSPPSSSYNFDKVGLPFFQGKTEFTEKHPEVRKYCDSPTRIAEAGDILISIRAPVGPTNIADCKCGIGRGLASIRKSKALSAGYIRYFLKLTESSLAAQGTGTTFTAITKRVLDNHPICIPPLAEQGRIVSKVDELFSNIEAGERAIAQARTALQRYRKSVLKAAVTGALTAEWRKTHPPEESADQLLSRILKARYEEWEKAELAKLTAKNKIHPKTEKQWQKFSARYKAPLEPETNKLPVLPQGWVWTSQDMVLKELITGPFGSMLHKSDYVESGIPLVNPISIVNGKIIRGKLKFLDQKTVSRLERFRLIADDVVIARRGDMGRCASVLAEQNGWLCGTGSMILRPTQDILTEYLSQSLQNGHALAYLNANAIGTTMKNLNRTILKLVPIAICSIEEQEDVISQVGLSLSKADAAEATLDAQARAARALKQAVLKTAFEGCLVPQDPNDEPASELLKRIKEEAA